MVFLLRLKHWQFFLLIILVPLLIAIGFSYILHPIGQHGFHLVSTITPGIFFWVLLFSWLINAIKILDYQNQILTKRQLFVVKYSVYFLIFYALKLLNIDLQLWTYYPTLIPFEILSILTHFLVFFLFFYFIFLLAKSFAVKKHGLDYRLEDLIIEIIKIYFFPVGIWFLQPHINEFYVEFKKNKVRYANTQS